MRGSFNRISFWETSYFEIGVGVGSFPYKVTLRVYLGFWAADVGFGKRFDK